MKAVIWTDASCRPSPGYGGYGVFGFTYKEAKRPKNVNHPAKNKYRFAANGIFGKLTAAEQKLEDDEALYAEQEEENEEDSPPTPPPSKKPSTLKPDPRPIEVCSIYETIRCVQNPQSTNNELELHAAIAALQMLTTVEGLTEVLLYTDSKYLTIGYHEHLPTWRNNGWKRKGTQQPIVQMSEWTSLDTYCRILQSKGVQLRIEWVEAHTSDYGNDMADLFSVVGSNAARYQCEHRIEPFVTNLYTSFVDYADYKASYHKDFIYHFKDLFFTSAPLEDSQFCFVTQHEEEKIKKNMTSSNQIGKRDNTTIFMAVHGQVPDLINQIKTFYRSIPRNYVASCTARLNRLDDRDMLRLAQRVPVRYLLVPIPKNTKQGYSLVAPSGRPQLIFLQETAIEFPFITVVNKVSALTQKLPQITNSSTTHVWDVTDKFFDSGKLLLRSNDKFLDLTPLTHGHLTMVQRLVANMGVDFPSYLALKKIEDEVLRVEVILDGTHNTNLYTLFTKITTADRQLYSLNVVNKYLAVGVHS